LSHLPLPSSTRHRATAPWNPLPPDHSSTPKPNVGSRAEGARRAVSAQSVCSNRCRLDPAGITLSGCTTLSCHTSSAPSATGPNLSPTPNHNPTPWGLLQVRGQGMRRALFLLKQTPAGSSQQLLSRHKARLTLPAIFPAPNTRHSREIGPPQDPPPKNLGRAHQCHTHLGSSQQPSRRCRRLAPAELPQSPSALLPPAA
jgi:hypothetical protein